MKRAIKKYGIENFSKEILFSFDNEEEMNSKEKELVDEEYLKRDDIYNLCPGGQGGFGYINENGMNNNNHDFEKMKKINSETFKQKWKDEKFRSMIIELTKLNHENGKMKSGYFGNRGDIDKIITGKAWSEEAKIKRAETQKKNLFQQGSKNSQFGTCWITNGIENKKIKKEDLQLWIEQGYTKGYPRLKK